MRKLGVVVKRSRRTTSVRFPIGFVRETLTGQRPPLARLVRAGNVRLKLHLTLALMATKDPFEINEAPPAHWFASMLDLQDPETSGARRVNEALTWLDREGLIVRTRRPGLTHHIKLLLHGSHSVVSGRYVQAPLRIWSDGLILEMSARALGIYLVLKEATGGRPDRSATLSGSRKAQYGLSDETWARAADELAKAGLLEVEEVFERATSRDEYEPKRRRQLYTLTDQALDRAPEGDSSKT